MKRREVTGALAIGMTLAAMALRPSQAQSPATSGSAQKSRVGMLVYPDMILMDLVGPLTVFSIMMADVHLVAKERVPVSPDVGLSITPTDTYYTCPEDLDVLFVPGGLKGTIAAMQDSETLEFLADRGKRARYVTSVCTGSLALAAAGLLRGFRATSHWYVRDLLPMLGATMVADRVVIDRNRITAGGVTAGIDFGLRLCALLRDEEFARRVQLLLEYAPRPPFDAGEPESAGPKLVAEILERRAPLINAARDAVRHAAARLH